MVDALAGRRRYMLTDIGLSWRLYLMLEPRLTDIDLSASRYSRREVSRYQLAHLRVAFGIRGSAQDHGDDVLVLASNGSDQVVSGSFRVPGLDAVDAL